VGFRSFRTVSSRGGIFDLFTSSGVAFLKIELLNDKDESSSNPSKMASIRAGSVSWVTQLAKHHETY